MREIKTITAAAAPKPKPKVLKRFWMAFHKYLCQREIKHKTFSGKYFDIHTARQKWASENDIVILHDRWKMNHPMRKMHKQTVFYVEVNTWTRLLGFKRKAPIDNIMQR